MYIQALKSLISKMLQVKKLEVELIGKEAKKELIAYAKSRAKNVSKETEIYNSYDILLNVYIQLERSLKIGWDIDEMDVENSINYFLKIE